MSLKSINIFIFILISCTAISKILCAKNLKRIDDSKLSNDLNAHEQHHSFKRGLKTVEKLMTEDEFMAQLICDVCDRHECQPAYCYNCKSCDLEKPKENQVVKRDKIKRLQNKLFS